MKKLIGLGMVLLSGLGSVYGQELETSRICGKEKMKGMLLAKTTVANAAEDDYDMRYVKFNLSLTNQNTSISGDVTTVASVAAPSLSEYVFELNDQLDIDSLLFDGQSLSVATSGYTRTVMLPAPLLQNAVFTVQVFYHGQPTGGTGFFSVGINNQQSPSWGNKVTYTLSEPYESKDWWPTKQSLTDKLDSADTWITVSSNLKAGGNGVLKAVTVLPNNKTRYEWSVRFPIDYYLLSTSVASYVDYSYYVHFPGSSDSMLVQNYVYDNPQTLPFFKNRIDSVGDMLVYFSKLYGQYPFWREKYGHCMAPISGGMEHQTMTTLGNFGTTLSVHELGHQWFGDNVTCGSWKDIWLNEGFAAYTEYLYKEHFWTPAQAQAHLRDLDTSVRAQAGGSVYVDDTTNENRIFSSRLTYDKGSAVLHALRFVFNNDSLYFQACRTYQQLFAGGTATTPDLKNVAAQAIGQNLDTFFDQWIYGEGYPVFDARWNQTGNQVFVQLNQMGSKPSSVLLFHTPVELKLVSAQGDTTVRVYNDQASQMFQFTWNKPMQDVVIDPNYWLVNDNNGVVHDIHLSTSDIAAPTAIQIAPNPAHDSWKVSSIPANSLLQLTDISGRLIWSNIAAGTSVVPAGGLTPGIYVLRVNNEQGPVSFKLVKQ